MLKKLRIDKRSLLLILGLLLLAAVIVISLTGRSKAKYKTQLVVANQVSYQNELADRFALLDIPVIIQEDGSYEKDEAAEAKPTGGFSYKLIPGIDIPAAPYIEIENKTVIPAYLYFEVVCPEGAPELLVNEDWNKLEGMEGKFGGEVYAYQDVVVKAEPTQEETAEETGEEAETSDIMTFPTFTVKTLSPTPTSFESGVVKVYAYMIRQEEGKTAAEAFAEAPAPNPPANPAPETDG